MFVQLKKVEIIVEMIMTPKIIRVIDDLGLPGYSIIHNVVGRGVHGTHDAQEVTDVLSNDCILVLCAQEEAQKLVQEISPILEKYGGICYMSDVQKLKID